MALEVDAFVSTGATLAVGKAPVFDSVAIGASSGIVEVIKIMDGTAGSTAVVPASSGSALDAIGLQVNVVNSTKTPIGVALTGGQSSVTVVGNVNVTFSTASTGSVIIANTTAAPANVQLVFNSSLVSTSTPLPVLLQNSTATVTIQGNSSVVISGNSTAIISSASIIKVDTIGAFPANSSLVVVNAAIPQSSVTLSTQGMGGSTTSPIFAQLITRGLAGSTYSNNKITSTAAATPFSSAASTAFNITGVIAINKGATLSVMSIYTGSTAGTLLFQTALASGGGGFVWNGTMNTPPGTTGSAITVECIPASTIYLHLDAYKSS